MDASERALYIGERLGGRYRVLEWRGGGAFAGVFRAEDSVVGVDVAVKVLSLRSGAQAQVEFDGERDMLAALAHCGNVVRLLDSGTHDMVLRGAAGGAMVAPMKYLVLELADANLAELLVRRRELDWPTKLDLFRGAVLGVHQVHRARCVHRDCKSDNCLVMGGRPDAIVSDFGRSRDTRKPARFAVGDYEFGRGDLRFAPPELLWGLGEADDFELMARGDLYLLGSIWFEVATGVGLTSLALGDPLALRASVARLPELVRRREFQVRTTELREYYESAYEQFKAELPPVLRSSGVQLLRLLTDPDPQRRTPPFRRRRQADVWDLQWLLRRLDVMRQMLRADAARAARRMRQRISR
jgi:eukaryotic-like serine/threonine-protein kinase